MHYVACVAGPEEEKKGVSLIIRKREGETPALREFLPFLPLSANATQVTRNEAPFVRSFFTGDPKVCVPI